MSWNVMHACGGLRLEIIKKFAPRDVSKSYFKSRENPKIIHYAGYSKPWNNLADDFGEVFWDTIRDSTFYELLFSNSIKNNIDKNNKPAKTYTPENESALRKRLGKVPFIVKIYNYMKKVAGKI